MTALFFPTNQNRTPLRFWFFTVFVFAAAGLWGQPVVVPLYPGTAPGSEQWNGTEGETTNTPARFRIAYNVSRPTLTVYRPAVANGTAVLLIPGGGMYVVNIENEGEQVAKKLVQKGLTVFVLKYRTGRTTTADPWQEMMGNLKDTALNRRKLEGVRPLVIADAFAALKHLRSRAAAYGIDANKVGVVGFSAGGSLTLRLCTASDSAARPNFAGLVYTVYRPAPGDTLPATIPPVFIAAAADDALATPTYSTALFDAWTRVRRPAELHIFARGGHGLRGSAPAANWLARFEDWLAELGLLK